MNRLTITLPDDLYAMARSYAVANRKSISKAIGDPLRQSRGAPANRPFPLPDADFHIDPVTQLPVVRGKAERITNEDVRLADDDEDIRHMEEFGRTTDKLEQARDR